MNKSSAPVRWEELTWEGVAGLRDSGIDMAILPVGATEQHGLHLPLGVDSFSATAVAEGVSSRTGIPVLPTLSYGCSLGHSSKWPGTISLRPETLARLVLEIAEWVVSAGFGRLLLLNGHVTNWAPLRCGLESVRHEFPKLRIALRSIWEISGEINTHYHEDAANFHANCAETSVMLAVRPELVRMDKAVDEPDRAARCFFAYSMDKETEHGAVGNPTHATKAFGQELLELCIEQLSLQLETALTEGTPLQTIPPEPTP